MVHSHNTGRKISEPISFMINYPVLVFFLLVGLSAPSNAEKLIYANASRMESRIQALSKYGANIEGGVSRVGFSQADIQAREYMMNLMRKAGLEVNIDQVGNIIGRRKGNNNVLAPIAFGSHIDSVPFGGNYDGDVGVIAALECIELLNANNIITQHSLEMIIFADEEGGLTGSMGMIGALGSKDLNRMSNSGKVTKHGINDIGGDSDQLAMAIKGKGEIKAFLEVHIEQGAILDTENIDIGVVTGIVGMEWWNVTIKGKANHAGTTPMNLRQDAMRAAGRFIVAANELVRGMPGKQVLTIGQLNVEPGAVNVIPEKVTLSLEIRDLSKDKVFSLFELVKQQAVLIEKQTDTQISFASQFSGLPAMTDKKIQKLIALSAKEMGYSFKSMPSGAGHDAQDMAKITPIGMIFVPSKDGISHSPLEYTSPQDMANGANVLFSTILKIDKSDL